MLRTRSSSFAASMKEGVTIFLIMFFMSVAEQISVQASVTEDDVKCLAGVKDSLIDPDKQLSTWNFSYQGIGYVCSFSGVSCWNPEENRVLVLNLPNMSLVGSVPSSLQYCLSLNSLDLSSNYISGSIPAALCDWLPFLVSLDLSSNNLSGPIPSELANCRFLNSLNLASNQLSGAMPSSLVRLDRLHTLDISDNSLSGRIPGPLHDLYPNAFKGNPLLFQHHNPLSVSLTVFLCTNLIAGSFGFACSFLFLLYFFRTKADQIVTLFDKPLVPLTVRNLVAAVGNFKPNLIINAVDTLNLTTYKAVLADGSELAIKRLQVCDLDEENFDCEMDLLRQLRHPNLVPLLGYCTNTTEQLLIYKHMLGGPLVDIIHADPCMLDWPTRLRISIGVAYGLAWLHHGLELQFVHGNINSQSVLLDDDLEPRLTNYCLAQFSASVYVEDYGTKSDIYDFGLVMLELLTGKKPTDTVNDVGSRACFNLDLVDWVNRLEQEGRIIEAIDGSIRDKGYNSEILDYHRVAVSCLADLPEERFSMNCVYKSLRKIGGLRHCTYYFDGFPLLYRLDEEQIYQDDPNLGYNAL